jgi:hypothetical protein
MLSPSWFNVERANMSDVIVKLYRDSNITTDRIRAEAAADRLALPDRVLAVFGGAGGGVPYFDNVSDAVAYAQSLTPSRSMPVTIRLFTDAQGMPYTLDGFDYYTLYDAGIVVESAYDVWQKFIFAGGELDAGDLLYDIDLSRTKIEIQL